MYLLIQIDQTLVDRFLNAECDGDVGLVVEMLDAGMSVDINDKHVITSFMLAVDKN